MASHVSYICQPYENHPPISVAEQMENFFSLMQSMAISFWSISKKLRVCGSNEAP